MHIDPAAHPVTRTDLDPDPPIRLSHVTHTMRRYRVPILTSLAGLALLYLIAALTLYLISRTERITTQSFLLDFEGAGRGRYPNGGKFNVADIVSAPIIARVFRDNGLSTYMDFATFSRSVFVLESNQEYERLAAEYQARLGDTRLSAVDRERMEREFQLKRSSIVNSEYSLSMTRRDGMKEIPETLVRKALLDLLSSWADFAVNQQHVLTYQVSALSPDIVKPTPIEQSDPIVAIVSLRQKAYLVMRNIDAINELPGAKLVRSPSDNASLDEVRMRLDEMVRFRLEPLLAIAISSGVNPDRVATARFLESQVAHEQRQLQAALRAVQATRDAILLYEQPAASERPEILQNRQQPRSTAEPTTEGITPQLSDSFLDRLVALTQRSFDKDYRQKLIDDYRDSVKATIPLEQAVSYQTSVLAELRRPPTIATRTDVAAVRRQADEMRSEVAGLIRKMNELFKTVSTNMTPSTQLYTLTGPPSVRKVGGVNPRRLALTGLLMLLVALPVILAACLLHNRVREEEAAEAEHIQEHATSS